MDLQKLLDNAVRASRAKEMLTSEQLTIGELILKLGAVTNKDLTIVFDDGKHKPTGLGSWRGSYCELAIQYEGGGGTCYEQPEPDCKIGEFGIHAYDCKCGGRKKYALTLPDKPTVKDVIEKLQLILGKYVVGYKGGDFTMGKTTPVWVANYGNSNGFIEGNQAVIDVKELADKAVIETKRLDR